MAVEFHLGRMESNSIGRSPRNASVALRLVEYNFLITWTVMLKPVFVAVLRINLTTVSKHSNITPWQARVTCEKKRRSIGLYFEQQVG